MKLSQQVIISRVAAGVLGSYVFSWGFAALGIAALVAWDRSFHEAEEAVLMLALLLYLIVFLWAFAASSMLRVWIVLVGGGAAMAAAAQGIQHYLLAGG